MKELAKGAENGEEGVFQRRSFLIKGGIKGPASKVRRRVHKISNSIGRTINNFQLILNLLNFLCQVMESFVFLLLWEAAVCKDLLLPSQDLVQLLMEPCLSGLQVCQRHRFL